MELSSNAYHNFNDHNNYNFYDYGKYNADHNKDCQAAPDCLNNEGLESKNQKLWFFVINNYNFCSIFRRVWSALNSSKFAESN